MAKDFRSGSGKMNDSEVKSTYCSCRGPKFNTQNLHGSSEPSGTPVPEDPMLSIDFCELLHICGAHIYIQAHTYA